MKNPQDPDEEAGRKILETHIGWGDDGGGVDVKLLTL